MNIKTLARLPIILSQALWVVARTARLPEAAGDRNGKTGQGRPLRLLVLGDSSAAGVGVTCQSQALGGQVSDALAAQFLVEWRVVARSGATARSMAPALRHLPDQRFDIALVALGVNDAKNGVSLAAWTKAYDQLLDTLQGRFACRCICVSGLPPVRQFPALPSPLNEVLGARTERFDTRLRQIARHRSGVVHMPVDFPMDATKMATDGFHPGPEIYREWGVRAAQVFVTALAADTPPQS